MRKVDKAENFEADLESCRREAKASFGNDEVLREKWITSPRHIEVQVFGDSHGNVVHLFERDCSLQRRHQKVIEEAPAPGMDEATREEICAAAVRAAKAVDYEGAGTIEFIADASEGLRADRIFFMEMNTRLQVEHPVTEMITGLDLVEWQLRVAAGEPLPLTQAQLRMNGHAIEARLYAEDPLADFLPSTGDLEHFDLGALGRIETGVEEGDAISPYYDPMVAKLVAWDESRDGAIEILAEIAESAEIWPVRTNAAFLANALTDDEFLEASLDTGFIARKIDDLLPPTDADATIWQRAAEFVVLAEREDADGPTGFRLNSPINLAVHLSRKGETRSIVAGTEEGAILATGFVDGERVVVFSEGQSFEFYRAERGAGVHHAHDGDIIAPMPGKVIAVDVAEGDAVTAGQRLMVLEAMKMEHALTAPFDGTVTELTASAGAQVQVEALLAVVEPVEE